MSTSRATTIGVVSVRELAGWAGGIVESYMFEDWKAMVLTEVNQTVVRTDDGVCLLARRDSTSEPARHFRHLRSHSEFTSALGNACRLWGRLPGDPPDAPFSPLEDGALVQIFYQGVVWQLIQA